MNVIIVSLCWALFSFIYFLHVSRYKSHKKKLEEDFQVSMRRKQKFYKEAFKEFVSYSLYWKHLPNLNYDVQYIIYTNLKNDLNGHLWCETCEKCVLKIVHSQYNVEWSYKCINDKVECSRCFEHRKHKQLIPPVKPIHSRKKRLVFVYVVLTIFAFFQITIPDIVSVKPTNIRNISKKICFES